ncbi:MAG: sugar phosphate isomerase/epimerase [Oscillospiraceae bacterium]|nr:sugar phosphate isomerase/epimerase [Oscillospiraceae bacterium]
MDANTHSEEALETFIRGLAPVVEQAEHWGVSVAIEPVWKHIVYDADRAVQVLRAIASPNLRIILDPVNLLYAGNADERDRVIGEAIDKLGEHVAVVHIKDFVREGDSLRAVAAGTGEMDYTRILRFMKERKPYIHATLENTTNDNAEASRELLQRKYEEI